MDERAGDSISANFARHLFPFSLACLPLRTGICCCANIEAPRSLRTLETNFGVIITESRAHTDAHTRKHASAQASNGPATKIKHQRPTSKIRHRRAATKIRHQRPPTKIRRQRLVTKIRHEQHKSDPNCKQQKSDTNDQQ